MVVAFMTALAAKGLGLSSSVDKALGLPEQIGGVHRQWYVSLNDRECNIGMDLDLVAFIVE